RKRMDNRTAFLNTIAQALGRPLRFEPQADVAPVNNYANDASFWLFKGYFDLSVKDTLKTWGLLELVNSVVGLIIVLIISMIA
uniref:GntT/GntP/DsdX family permease n=1 Tax=Citrobacter freundii TaxID=546 RepID=UPI0040559A29